MVLTLLCTLGSFSILAFLFVLTSASRQWALALLGVYFVIGSVAGFSANALHETFFVAPEWAKIRAVTATAPQTTTLAATRANVQSATAAAPITYETVSQSNGVTLTRAPFIPGAAADDQATFIQHDGPALGITGGFQYGVRDYSDPF